MDNIDDLLDTGSFDFLRLLLSQTDAPLEISDPLGDARAGGSCDNAPMTVTEPGPNFAATATGWGDIGASSTSTGLNTDVSPDPNVNLACIAARLWRQPADDNGPTPAGERATAAELSPQSQTDDNGPTPAGEWTAVVELTPQSQADNNGPTPAGEWATAAELSPRADGMVTRADGNASAPPFETVVSNNVGCANESETDRQRKKRARTQQLQILAFQQKHAVRPVPSACVGGKCKFQCTSHFAETQRQNINSAVNSLPRDARQQWYATHVSDITPILSESPPLTNSASAKRRIIAYHLPLADGTERRVCKEVCLTTIGFASNNDGPVISAVGRLTPKPDMRGKASPLFAVNLAEVLKNHIERYRPITPHYRYLHAPNRRYLPPDISAAVMYRHLVEEKGTICSYERFRQALRSANVSFARLGSEECETCKAFSMHVTACDNHETCSVCQEHAAHLDRAEKARAEYARDRQRQATEDDLFVSADMMRVTLLPILPHKVCAFTPRLIAYNETFAALGGKRGVCILWHEGVSGRDAPDVASVFMTFAELNNNVKLLTFWVDNCSAQNKN